MRNFLLLALLAATSAPAAQAPSTAPAVRGYVAEYALLRNGKQEGRASITLAALDDGNWELRNETRGTSGLAGLIGFRIDERSRVQWRDGLPATRGYAYRQKAAFKSRERSLRLDAQGAHIVSRDGKHEYLLDYREDVHDRQSVSLALAHDIAHGASGEREYAVADREAIKTHRYRIGERERLVTAAGEFDTVHVLRIRDNDNAHGRITNTWFADTAQPFPVRLQQTEPDGDRIEMRLTAYRQP